MVSRVARGDYQHSLGRALRLRPKKGLSKEELTDLADINETYLSGVERGKRNPAITVFQHIAEALGADIEDWYQGAGRVRERVEAGSRSE